MRETGIYQISEDSRYFTSHLLPPKNPDLQLITKLMALYRKAGFTLAKLVK